MLIAEDSPQAQAVLRDYFLPCKDIEICAQVTDGLQVMPLVKSTHPHIVLQDIMMPGKDGTAILREMQEMPLSQRPHVIITSALNTESVARETLDLGAEFYYIKPYDPAEVLRRIRVVAQAPVRPVSVQRKMQAVFSLVNMGAEIGLAGTTYAAEAACYLEKDCGTPSLRKDVYHYISKKYSTTIPCVENALHTVVKNLCQKRTPGFCAMLQSSGYDGTETLSNGQFLLVFAAYIRQNGVQGSVAL